MPEGGAHEEGEDHDQERAEHEPQVEEQRHARASNARPITPARPSVARGGSGASSPSPPPSGRGGSGTPSMVVPKLERSRAKKLRLASSQRMRTCSRETS